MKSIIRVLIFCSAIVTVADTTHAQEARIGFGIGLTSMTFGIQQVDIPTLLFTPTSIYIPITMSNFRLEPEIGLARSSVSNDNFSETSTIIQLGTGIFLLAPMNATHVYFGGRIGVTLRSVSREFPGGGDSSSTTDLFLGPATGGEHFFGRHFSLGGEVQLLYTSIGTEDDADISASVIGTRALLFVRWHL